MELFIPVVIGLVAGILGGLLGIGGSLIIIPGMVIYMSHTAAGYHGIDQHLLQAAAMIVNVFVAALVGDPPLPGWARSCGRSWSG